MKFALFAACIIMSLHAIAAEVKYPVTSIPSELKENANVVIREDHMKFRIIEKNRAIQHVLVVATILNERGHRFSDYREKHVKLCCPGQI